MATIDFDAAYYLSHNADVKAAVDAGVMTAVQHWTQYGFKEGRDPSALFDTSYYLQKNPDVAHAGIDPLAHFNSFGANETRDPAAYFDDSYYLAMNKDVAAAVASGSITAFGHFLTYGLAEGRMPSQQIAAQFDSQGYLHANPDVAAAIASHAVHNPLEHFLLHGAAEGRLGAGIDLASFTRTTAGTVADGYLSGATVFIDGNGNGQLDPSEQSTTTNSSGHFSIGDANGGTLVIHGGTDISTGKVNDTVLSAPPGSSVVNLLTTLIEETASQGGLSLQQAEAQVSKALGLSDALALTSFDPFDAAKTGNAADIANAVGVQTQIAKLFNLVNLGSSQIAAASGGQVSGDQADHSLLAALADQLLSGAQSGTPVDLNSTSFAQGLLDHAESGYAGTSFFDALHAADAAVSQLAGSFNAKLDAQVGGSADAADLARIAAAQVVFADAQSSMSTALGQGASLSQEWLDGFTGNALDTAVSNEESQMPELNGGPGGGEPPPPPPTGLMGTPGDDTLMGPGGNETMTGLAGADTFEHPGTPAYGIDTITDFSAAEGDKVQLDAGSASDYTLNAGGTELRDVATDSFGFTFTAALNTQDLGDDNSSFAGGGHLLTAGTDAALNGGDGNDLLVSFAADGKILDGGDGTTASSTIRPAATPWWAGPAATR